MTQYELILPFLRTQPVVSRRHSFSFSWPPVSFLARCKYFLSYRTGVLIAFQLYVVECLLASGRGWRSTAWACLTLCDAGRAEVATRRTTTSATSIRIRIIPITTIIIIIIIIMSNTQPDSVSITRYRAFLPGKDKELLEKVRRRFTKMIKGMKRKS